jgi:hypothetical protein
MIYKTSQTPPFRSINILALLHHHKVKVLDALFIVVVHSCAKRGLVNDLADILVDEGALGEGREGAYAVALCFCLDDVDGGVFCVLEASVSTECAEGAGCVGGVCAFHRGCKVDAVVVTARHVPPVLCNHHQTPGGKDVEREG